MNRLQGYQFNALRRLIGYVRVVDKPYEGCLASASLASNNGYGGIRQIGEQGRRIQMVLLVRLDNIEHWTGEVRLCRSCDPNGF